MSFSPFFALPAATIPLNGSVSSSLKLSSYHVIGIIMPAAWDAAPLTFRTTMLDDALTDAEITSANGWLDVYDATGTEVSVAAAAGRAIMLSPILLHGVRRISVRSGAAGAPVNQTTGARQIVLLGRAYA